MRCRYEETMFRNENDGYCVLCYSTETQRFRKEPEINTEEKTGSFLLQLVQNFLLRKIRR